MWSVYWDRTGLVYTIYNFAFVLLGVFTHIDPTPFAHVSGYSLLVFLYGSLVLKSDWKLYAEIARKRVEASDE